MGWSSMTFTWSRCVWPVAIGLIAAGCGTALEDCPDHFACPRGVTSGTGGGGGGGGAGGMSEPLDGACVTAADCPGPPDHRCGRAECIEGRCAMQAEPLGKLAVQYVGDCVSRYCDGFGDVVTLPDGEDIFNDGKLCTFDICLGGVPTNVALPDGSPCREGGSGFCLDGECVECIDIDTIDACPGLICDHIYCAPEHCGDGNVNGGETGFNCGGGQCKPCPIGLPCNTGTDCAEGVCIEGICAVPTCLDGAKNGGETDIDCGVTTCSKPCANGQGCSRPDDCASKVCLVGICLKPTCVDGIQNGDESGEDCGGPCDACP